MFAYRSRWLISQTQFWAIAVGLFRPDRPRAKIAATSRANVVKFVVYAIGTIGAFIATDAGIH